MSNKVIVFWGIIITLLCSAIYIIGVYYKNELDYINLKTKIKTSVKEYINKENKDLPLEITSEELEKKGYIGKLELEEKICAADIKVTKKFLMNNYDINFTCINPE